MFHSSARSLVSIRASAHGSIIVNIMLRRSIGLDQAQEICD